MSIWQLFWPVTVLSLIAWGLAIRRNDNAFILFGLLLSLPFLGYLSATPSGRWWVWPILAGLSASWLAMRRGRRAWAAVFLSPLMITALALAFAVISQGRG
jgi:hypothetical protein